MGTGYDIKTIPARAFIIVIMGSTVRLSEAHSKTHHCVCVCPDTFQPCFITMWKQPEAAVHRCCLHPQFFCQSPSLCVFIAPIAGVLFLKMSPSLSQSVWQTKEGLQYTTHYDGGCGKNTWWLETVTVPLLSSVFFPPHYNTQCLTFSSFELTFHNTKVWLGLLC